MTRDTLRLLAHFSRALGDPAATPEWVCARDGELERARYRVFRWRCCVCRGGWDDPDGIWRPLVIDSDGHVRCEAAGCSPERIAAAVRVLLDIEKLLDSLGIAA